MMNPEEIKSLLPAYVFGELAPDIAEKVRAGLEAYPDCQEELRQIQILSEKFGEVEMEHPGPQLEASFMEMLHTEKQIATARFYRHAEGGFFRRIRNLWAYSPAFQVGAAVFLLLCGIGIGLFVQSNSGVPSSHAEVARLTDEVVAMKNMVMLAMLDRPSPSERIKAVSYVDEITQPDTQVIEALIHTMNHDENINVRLAAIQGLNRFSQDAAVRDALIDGLKTQTDPMLQVILINTMVEWKEKAAIGYIEELLNKAETQDIVKKQAKKGLEILM